MTARGAFSDAETSLRRNHGVHVIRCSLPIPGTVNIYFVREPVPTLIDVPAAGNQFVDELDRGLRQAGSSLDAIKRILVTHPHFDHYGSAQEIVNRSGAELYVFQDSAVWVEESNEEYFRREEQRLSLLPEWGVPTADTEAVICYYHEANCFRERAKPARRISAGDTLLLGQEDFTVVPVPGHTPFCVMFYSPEGRIGFTGDFLPVLVPGKSPLVQWTDADLCGYRATSAYVSSLKETGALKFDLALPGHGPLITDPSKKIERLLGAIAKRREEILKVIERVEKTPFEIASLLFPGTPRKNLFRMVSDVMGQLEMLEDEGFVVKSTMAPYRFVRV
jgi:glyoxylase-like metal-dependent hydrolase (beta-lactamase superfamily II)